jgi:HlyD family secretion protein
MGVIAVAASVATGAFFHWRRDDVISNELTLHGNVDVRQVELAFNASGRITEIDARKGDRVTSGQLLARLDTERLLLTLRQAEAQAAAQREAVKRLEAGSRPEEIR